MPVTSSIVAQGSLTGGYDLLHTSTGTEAIIATFPNYSTGGGTLSFWVNGTANYQAIGTPAIPLASHETVKLKVKLGNTDTLYAQGSEETFGYTLELDLLS